MPRESTLSYEKVQAAAYRFLDTYGRMPKNEEIRSVLKCASIDNSKYMKMWREEVSSLKKVKWKANLKPVEAVIALTIEEVVAVETRDLEEQLQAAHDDADTLRSELDSTISERDDALAALKGERLRSARLEAELNSSRSESSRQHGDLARAQSEISQLNQVVGGYKAELATEKGKSAGLERQTEADAATNKAMVDEIERLKGRLRLLE